MRLRGVVFALGGLLGLPVLMAAPADREVEVLVRGPGPAGSPLLYLLYVGVAGDHARDVGTAREPRVQLGQVGHVPREHQPHQSGAGQRTPGSACGSLLGAAEDALQQQTDLGPQEGRQQHVVGMTIARGHTLHCLQSQVKQTVALASGPGSLGERLAGGSRVPDHVVADKLTRLRLARQRLGLRVDVLRHHLENVLVEERHLVGAHHLRRVVLDLLPAFVGEADDRQAQVLRSRR